MLIFGLAGEVVAWLLLAEDYRRGAAPIFVWVGAAYAVLAMSLPIENRLLATGQSRTLILPKVGGALVNIMVAAVIVPNHAAIGAGLANLAGQLALLASSTLLLWLVLRMHRPVRQLIP